MGPVTAYGLEILITLFQVAWGLLWCGMLVGGLVALGRWLARRPSSSGKRATGLREPGSRSPQATRQSPDAEIYLELFHRDGAGQPPDIGDFL